MAKIILDSNIWISFLLGFQKETVRSLLTETTVYLCDQLLDELQTVVGRPKIRRHCSEEDVAALFKIMRTYCRYVAGRFGSSGTAVRDVKDAYLLQFAQYIGADYLVTGDKDMLVLDEFAGVKIVSLADLRARL